MQVTRAATICRTTISRQHRAAISHYRALASESRPNKKKEQVPLTAAAVAKDSAALKPPTPRLDKPIQNWRDMMSALDIMIEEAEKKIEKKYRPNMFAEFKQLNDTNGKVVEGSHELIPVDTAKTVPSLIIKSLNDEVHDVEKLVTNRITLVCTSFKNFGLNMLPPWYQPFLATFETNKSVQVVSLNIIEDWYMRVVKSSIHRGLRQRISEQLIPTTFTHFGRCDSFRTTLDLYNSYIGYVHLVDSKGRIRWIAGGPATPEELQRLMNVTRQLIDQETQSKQRRR